jgi:cobalt-zinc-cadmium efflux system protein
MSAHGEHRKPAALGLALVLTGAVALFECAGGIAARSLALLADSAHVFMDVVALAIAWIAQRQAMRPATHRQTFGFARMEVLAALLNAALLSAVTAFIVVEAWRRFAVPETPSGALMMVVALIGGGVNAFIGVLLARHAGESLNARAALYHVFGDMLGAIAVIVGGAIVLVWHIPGVDPVLSLFVALLVMLGVAGIVREAVGILLESAPAHINVADVRAAMRAVEGVIDVHDLHVWTIGAHRHALSAHVLVPDRRVSACGAILRDLNTRLRRDFAVSHVTVQFECESCGEGQGCSSFDVNSDAL